MPLSYLPLNYAELFRAAMLYSVAAWAAFLLLVAAALLASILHENPARLTSLRGELRALGVALRDAA